MHLSGEHFSAGQIPHRFLTGEIPNTYAAVEMGVGVINNPGFGDYPTPGLRAFGDLDTPPARTCGAVEHPTYCGLRNPPRSYRR